MNTFNELFESSLRLEGVTRRDPIWETISETTVYPRRDTTPGQYENEVFEYLYLNRFDLGIHEVRRATNAKVDGAIILDRGKVVPMEIKFRMDWEKACQASWQITRFYEHYPSNERRYGLVVFSEFARDWNNQPQNRPYLYGWIRWYSEHVHESGMELHLAQFRNGIIQLGAPQLN